MFGLGIIEMAILLGVGTLILVGVIVALVVVANKQNK